METQFDDFVKVMPTGPGGGVLLVAYVPLQYHRHSQVSNAKIVWRVFIHLGFIFLLQDLVLPSVLTVWLSLPDLINDVGLFRPEIEP